MTTIGTSFMLAARGTFFRAVDPRLREFALAGSRSAGCYSRAYDSTHYLSSSVDGVRAATVAHNDARPDSLDIVAINVEASGIVDLRDVSALEAVGIDLEDAWLPGRPSPRPGQHRGRGRCVTASSKSVRTV